MSKTSPTPREVPSLPPYDGERKAEYALLMQARREALGAAILAEKREQVARKARRLATSRIQRYERLLLEYAGQEQLW